MNNFLKMALCFIYSIAVFGACPANSENSDIEIIDLNGDGVEDVFIEYDDSGYYQLTDRNFDGRIDESSRYTLDHYVVSGSSDDNFDGIFETTIEYEHSLVTRVLVDTNNNQLIDLVHFYKDGLIVSSEKYISENSNNNEKMTEQVALKFEYPISIERRPTSHTTEKSFHENAVARKPR